MRPTIVHVTTVHPRDDIRIFQKEVQSLGAARGRVILAVADGLGDADLADGRVHVLDMGRASKGRLMRMAGGSLRALRHLLRLRPAVMHFHDPELIPVALVLKAFGTKVVYDVHEDLPQQILGKPWIPAPLRRLASGGATLAEGVAKWAFDAFVTATPHIARNFPADRTVVVQNYPLVKELMAASPTPHAERPAQVAYVGNLTAGRGAREMVAAMDLLDASSAARLDIAGRIGPAALETALRAAPGARRVRFHGQLPRDVTLRLLATSRAGLVTFLPEPNHVEAQPNKLFEYMAAGLPVIASDFPLWRRIVSAADCGLLVDPANPKAISEAIQWVLDHPDEAEAMGRRGQAAVATLYTWEQEAKKLVDLYAKLLD